jgi:hypothetical protein
LVSASMEQDLNGRMKSLLDTALKNGLWINTYRITKFNSNS